MEVTRIAMVGSILGNQTEPRRRLRKEHWQVEVLILGPDTQKRLTFFVFAHRPLTLRITRAFYAAFDTLLYLSDRYR